MDKQQSAWSDMRRHGLEAAPWSKDIARHAIATTATKATINQISTIPSAWMEQRERQWHGAPMAWSANAMVGNSKKREMHSFRF
jgi:hypothetical protein